MSFFHSFPNLAANYCDLSKTLLPRLIDEQRYVKNQIVALDSNQSPRSPLNYNCPGTYWPQKDCKGKFSGLSVCGKSKLHLSQAKLVQQLCFSTKKTKSTIVEKYTGYKDIFQKREIGFRTL